MKDLPDDIATRWLAYGPDEAAGLEALLSPEEQARMLSFRHARRRRSFLMGRAAARGLLAERLGVEPPRVPLVVDEDGSVQVAGSPLTVSIAHSRDVAVAAVGERTLGIDLERIVPRHPDLQRFLLHPDEYGVFEAMPMDRTRACVLYWTLKEAALKALRTGFRLSPKKLRLEVDPDAGRALVHVTDGPVLHERFEERDAYFLAVAYAPETP